VSVDRRFVGKVVAVTGGAGGIGRAAAVRFASEGADVVLVDLTAGGLIDSAAAVAKAGGHAATVEADVTRASDVQRYVRTAVEHFGGLDYLFNNAGILGAVSPLTDYPEDTFDRVVAVNLRSVWLGMKIAAPAIIARGGGAIVNTASIAGLRGTPNLIAYTATKHAVVGMTRTASMELIRRGVRVNAVCPAPIETPMADRLEASFNPANPRAVRERLAGTIPMRRYGRAEEVAAVVAFLCSDDAAYVNGALYTVDGGAMA
jgi:NAD(P)-dependent dehydrogenase (short-subunit alcohol dehydrogenase family)